ncbi:MAG TPA: DUF2911 domain-containing protein [Cytophagaceae bacterium]|jgi:hypothetical protein|nr:DUF2911 domain-containing protein [Cytophagaceae bacterium]
MKKFFKWTAIIVGSLAVIIFGLLTFMNKQTKKASPEVTVEYKKNGKDISVFYCSPSKKGRIIFDSLVPYGKVWRTGANEATTFTTGTDLIIGEKALPAGKYTLWTIPGKDEWTVILNGKQYGWGVNFSFEASREADKDVLQVKVPAQTLDTPQEKFSITFPDSDSLKMVLAWDKTKVSVPIK